MQLLSGVGRYGEPETDIWVWFFKGEQDECNLGVDMDWMPLEGNVIFARVQQDRLGGMLCLKQGCGWNVVIFTFCSSEGGPRSPFTESQSLSPLVMPWIKFRSPWPSVVPAAKL